MTYFLRFARQLKKEGSQVIGDPEFDNFVVRVGTSEVAEVIQVLLKGFDKVALILDPRDDESSQNLDNPEQEEKSTAPSELPLRSVEDVAWVTKAADFNPEILAEVSTMLTKLLAEFPSKFEDVEVLSNELDREFLVLTEAMDLRNFLSRFVKNLSKPFKKGYLYILDS
jgi:hypothetical protein